MLVYGSSEEIIMDRRDILEAILLLGFGLGIAACFAYLCFIMFTCGF